MAIGATGIEWVYAGGGFVIGAAVATVFAQMRSAHFKIVAQDAVKGAHETFLQMAAENFKQTQKDGAHDLDRRQKAIDDLVKPVQKHLETLNSALEQVKGTDKALRDDLRNLNRETARLVGALRDPAAQGQWGEYILEGLLEKSGLMKGVHYETQVTMQTNDGRRRPDALISIQDGFQIAVDAKAPINEFTQRLGETLSEDDHLALTRNLAAQVRNHVKQLSQKGYWENIDSVDFTVMFLPSEHIYSLALRADPQLVDFAAQKNVIIASPTLLMSLLRVVVLSWRQVELAQNAQKISDLGADLYKRLITFSGHIEKIGKNIHMAMRGYDDAVGSFTRNVLPSAREFKDLQPGLTEDLPELGPIEQTPRLLSLSPKDEEELKKRRA